MHLINVVTEQMPLVIWHMFDVISVCGNSALQIMSLKVTSKKSAAISDSTFFVFYQTRIPDTSAEIFPAI